MATSPGWMRVFTKATTAGMFGTIMVAAYYDESRVTGQGLRAVTRIVNLVGTVGLMSSDYGSTMLLHRMRSTKTKIEEEYQDSVDELAKLQNLQETDTIVQLTTKDESIRDKVTRQIYQRRQDIDAISERIANLSSLSGFEECHMRNARRLRDMCQDNKGVYIKLGQHLAMLDYILPLEYTEALSTLLYRTPTSPWSCVRKVIKEDFGKYPEELFDTIERDPIASASLAQVHIAYLNGEKVAVKVQHQHLLEESKNDMRAITIIVDLVSRIFEGFTYNWLSREMNTNLPLELDFLLEAKNLLKCRDDLQGLIQTGDLVIPSVYPAATSKRVITMSFEDGTYVTDLPGIAKMKLKTSDISRLVSKTFCDQMYRHGFVHCDPHEGNILVRPHAKHPNKPTIVLLDHGLYKQMSDEFRLDYCRLWRGIVLGDGEMIKTTCEHMKVGPAYTLLAAMLTMRPWGDIVAQDRNKLQQKNSKGESAMLKAYARKYFKDIVQLLGRVDSELLLLLKTNDCLRHLDRKLGTPVNTTKIVASTTASVLLEEELKSTGDTDSFSAVYNFIQLHIRVVALKCIEFFTNSDPTQQG
jgi:aarF domain-containing kinase